MRVFFSGILCVGTIFAQADCKVVFMTPPFQFFRGHTGAPYFAREINESVSKGADGRIVRKKGSEFQHWRDAQGRARVEGPTFRTIYGQESSCEGVMVDIMDPVAKVRWILEPEKKLAHRLEAAPDANPPGTFPRGESPKASGPVAVPGGEVRPESASEWLEPRTLEGFLAEGFRSTRRWPAERAGKNGGRVEVMENWMARELGVQILQRFVDSQTGEHTMKLVGIVRGEVDPSLFVVPPDYTVVEEKERITIVGRKRKK